MFRVIEYLWRAFPFLRPRPEIARRFVGRIGWNCLELSKQDVIHSLAFRSDKWVDLMGFEMLRSDTSFRITFTVTKGRGVLGKLLTKGTGFVSAGDVLHPSRLVKLKSKVRIEPDCWYCINVVIEIHEYEMFVTTSSGTDGRAAIQTDSGVVIDYRPGLESCAKTTATEGQIAGIAFFRLENREEEHLVQSKMISKNSSIAATLSSKDIAIGESVAMLEGYPVAPNTFESDNEPPERQLACLGQSCKGAVNLNVETGNESLPTTITVKSQSTRTSLPPIAGVIAPPIRRQQNNSHPRTSS